MYGWGKVYPSLKNVSGFFNTVTSIFMLMSFLLSAWLIWLTLGKLMKWHSFALYKAKFCKNMLEQRSTNRDILNYFVLKI